MQEQITKITKEEARVAAKLYIASLFMLTDEFSTDTDHCASIAQSTREVDLKVQEAVNKEISKMVKSIDYEYLPTSTLDCLKMAKDIVRANKNK